MFLSSACENENGKKNQANSSLKEAAEILDREETDKTQVSKFTFHISHLLLRSLLCKHHETDLHFFHSPLVRQNINTFVHIYRIHMRLTNTNVKEGP